MTLSTRLLALVVGLAASVAGVSASLPDAVRVLDHELPDHAPLRGRSDSFRHPLPRPVSGPMATGRADSKSMEGRLFRRWLSIRAGDGVDAVRAEPFSARNFARYFPNTTFYRLTGRRGSRRVIQYACESLAEPLILPDEFNLLLILENRRVNDKNLRPLTELIVKLSDPEGMSTFNVLRQTVKRHWRTDEIESIALETWSYENRFRKKWTARVQFPYFYSLEEKLLSYRTEMFNPEYMTDDEISGPAQGDERYILFWRDPGVRHEMEAVRRKWREDRAARRRARFATP
jgi:hypothetical protein